MQPYDIVTARFEPRRRDDLRPGVAAYIGKTVRWRCLWEIEPGENQFEGQFAMGVVVTEGEEDPPFGWTPLEDLVIIEALHPANEVKGGVP